MRSRSARGFERTAIAAARGRWLALGLVLASISLASAATTDSGVTGGSLAGQLLIASPDMDDPRFAHAVILMVQHNKDGALGIIINRPVGELSYADLLKSICQTGSAASGKVRIFAGGPVQLNAGFVLHSPDYHRPETLDIDGRVAMTASPNVLRDIAEAKGPKKSLIAFGYAGWGPGQLETELMRHDWFTAPEDPSLVFDDDRGKVWKEAMARRSQEL
jgi:putative transcriptional regulator